MAPLPSPQELELTELAGVFHATHNPAAAWLAFHLAKKHNLPVPEIVANEIERFAAEVSKPLIAAWDGDGRARITTKDITTAWGCGRGTKLAQALRLSRRAASIVGEYWEKITSGVRSTDALSALMDGHNLSDKAVEEILTAARKKRDMDTPTF
ncbi:hypothetical protein JQ554_09390 [Bradyrhizobium diazoefficiens]|nr:hypothetical protein [Bradyrhizobium diazoefficiens]MBR0982251.1 hypothetical protein [Bradyrhizobium diazoefficiens]MBR1018165.1 hypothetical protein [Bradyrhizobium diazoefficiens]MBR1057450.1 hypothetical protein [Bradyrhizobium diazoefficiens]MBR1113313.1 hypothetical protein [Bradyrhizobium diazoefficiens]MBR1115180.1 hypothetical protein [Bradyrhizobium diazoefficiens]